MSGGEEKGSKRARKNYTSEVSLCTETVICAGLEDAIKPQHLDGLGEKLSEGSSVKQMAEEEFGELASLLGEPHDYIDTPTEVSVALLEQAESDPENIRAKLLELAVQLAGECHHSAPLKRWDPKDPKANTTCGKLQAQIDADVDIEVRRVVLAQQIFVPMQSCTSRSSLPVPFFRPDSNQGKNISAALSSQQRATTTPVYYHALTAINMKPQLGKRKCYTTAVDSILPR